MWGLMTTRCRTDAYFDVYLRGEGIGGRGGRVGKVLQEVEEKTL